MSYDKATISTTEVSWSQSLWNRAVSYDVGMAIESSADVVSQSLWNRAVSYDGRKDLSNIVVLMSQSLWNRAVSYDKKNMLANMHDFCLNPFGTGQCLTTNFHKIDENYLAFVSIPLEQGSVLRPCFRN